MKSLLTVSPPKPPPCLSATRTSVADTVSPPDAHLHQHLSAALQNLSAELLADLRRNISLPNNQAAETTTREGQKDPICACADTDLLAEALKPFAGTLSSFVSARAVSNRAHEGSLTFVTPYTAVTALHRRFSSLLLALRRCFTINRILLPKELTRKMSSGLSTGASPALYLGATWFNYGFFFGEDKTIFFSSHGSWSTISRSWIKLFG